MRTQKAFSQPSPLLSTREWSGFEKHGPRTSDISITWMLQEEDAQFLSQMYCQKADFKLSDAQCEAL